MSESISEKTYPIDNVFFHDLSALVPIEVCRRVSCDYDSKTQCYSFNAWEDEYLICPNESLITRIAKQNVHSPHEYFPVFIVHYLLHAKAIDVRGEWISEKDVPGGAAFFCGPHAIPGHFITDRFGNNIDAFKQRCRQLGGTSLEMGDAAYTFHITPRIPVAVLYWAGDDDFPPESKLLFDKSIADQLALDVIFAIAVDVCSRVGRFEAK